ncbi:Putative transport sensor protein [Escherichia coli]|uniref:Transport sensor protein n=1 Tax=Escherichia coli TaxID=562 RepID=A0A376W8R0_ECOLX|nr:Putative transport sensor protein [Escherichia coli]
MYSAVALLNHSMEKNNIEPTNKSPIHAVICQLR